jgi:hypothetical protein
MDSGDMMFLGAVIAAMAIFAVTLATVTWFTNRR